MALTQITRQEIIDLFEFHQFNWWGKLEEVDFLERLYNLRSLPTTDPRIRQFPTMQEDVWQHRVNNSDWPDTWVFRDPRLGLGEDGAFLRFLCETIHPAVRSPKEEALRICSLYNELLQSDGWEIRPSSSISGRPIFSPFEVAGLINLMPDQVVTSFGEGGMAYVSRQIGRMQQAIASDDPELAIGTAKELVETVCKTILARNGETVLPTEDLSQLYKRTATLLTLTPDQVTDEAKAEGIIKALLGNLSSITGRLAELRNAYGNGHGKDSAHKGLDLRHARLAVGAASTLTTFLVETDDDRRPPS